LVQVAQVRLTELETMVLAVRIPSLQALHHQAVAVVLVVAQ
jgi:hypothetical protein